MSSATSKTDYFQERALEVYLLPKTPWERVLVFQQQLVFEMGEEPRQKAALILCEHPSIITVGRQGSHRHLHVGDPAHPSTPVRWTNRGGACWHQQPGQLASYPILPLCASSFSLDRYRACLYETIEKVLAEFAIPAERHSDVGGVWAGRRQIAAVGIAVKHWVAYHGCILNVSIPVDDAPLADTALGGEHRWTCMFREIRAPVRVDGVRESFLRHFVQAFGFGNYYLCKAPSMTHEKKRASNAWAAHH